MSSPEHLRSQEYVTPTSGALELDQEVDGEAPLLVRPGATERESGSMRETFDVVERELVRRFRMNRFAGCKRNGEIDRLDPHRVRAASDQKRVDRTAYRRVVDFVVERPAELAIDPSQEVLIEGGRDSGRIVVSGFEDLDRLLQIDAEQHRVAALQRPPDRAQQLRRR